MVKLVGTGGNQVPTNNMLGNMAFQNKEGVSADLVSLAAGTAAAPSLIPSGDPNTGVWFPAADTIALSTNGSERLRIDSSGNVIVNTAAIATTATNGFLYIPGCAGTPTGVPTAQTGRVPLVVDTTNNKLYFYSGGAWRDAGP